jgi:arginine deiminase
MSSIEVFSEIGRLRQVMVHEPGPEVDCMAPEVMEELLFDDIIQGDSAREEHRCFRRVLETLGVEVLEAKTLLEEAFEVEAACEWVFSGLAPLVSPMTEAKLREASIPELASMMVEGVRYRGSQSSLDSDQLFVIPPLPNWCFQRDPQMVLGNGVVISSMATPARWREEYLAATIFRFHPRLSSAPRILDPRMPEAERPAHLGLTRPQIEGGDILVLSDEVVMVGYSERTNRTGVRHLARALSRLESGPRWMVVVRLPQRRAYMHLDTIITQIDHDAALVFPPVIAADGTQATEVFEIDLHSEELHPKHRDDVLSTLSRHGIDLEPIPCGGKDPLYQQREQWTDGANALAVAPGVITIYERNRRTADELASRGFEIVEAKDLLLGGSDVAIDEGQRTCILIPSHELSRARGGPHCLTEPLLRDKIG